MAYGDKLFQDGVEHIESHEGAALCDYPAKGYYVERKPGLTICKSCEFIFERDTTMLERWNKGAGLQGSNKVQDDPAIFVERVPGLGASILRPYIPRTAWDWNTAPGFDKNKNRKRR